MKPTVTRFDPQKAKTGQDGKLQALDLVPEGKESNLVFHWVEIKPDAELKMELNTVEKTFLIFEGQGTVVFADGNEFKVRPGDAVWLPQGSSHLIKNAGNVLKFIVVKAK
jgi:mannose-6-phosphate isomerase-like protein (cupin superfamily)